MKPEARARTEAWLEYFDALGISPFCIDPAAPSTASSEPIATVAEGIAHPVWAARAATSNSAPVAQPVPVLPVIKSASLFAANDRVEGDTLERIRDDVGDDCRRCKLCEQRNKIVFGAGSAKADLVFVGEGPGHDEDVQGLPFVGRAGKLLTQMISRLRGQWLEFRGIPLMATYHPAYLLRNPNAKGDVWEDLKKVMAHLGMKVPAKR